ncbi:meiosis regulator and mRNA stability factor 1-like [Panonychus citri]|uniref:meiosis regulator and mRNA stability factor 1-like n=1 Tax=Panonychus citri TaxID=50023 RepID=UPI0023082969|nr:meiosis regulator and mRNA stability factor 1-like [Panonychus citri]XP_053214507.1 meiosis regulator and mRNA stability factor 1-like [Panonychus citri]
MAKTPCAVFWDIQNIGVPKGQSAASIVSLIRSSIINLYELREIYFYCVCDVTKLPAYVGNPLTNEDVNVVQTYDYTKDSADIKILDLMRKFVQNQRQECAVILLSGDGDYATTLSELKKLYNITVFLIHLKNSFSAKLIETANYTFVLNKEGLIYPVKSCGRPKCLVAFSRYPMTRAIRLIKLDLNKMTKSYGSIDKSAIEHEDEIIIGFPSYELAHQAVLRLNSIRYHGTFLKAQLVVNPITEITIKMRSTCSSRLKRSKSCERPKSFRRVNSGRKESPDSQFRSGRLKETPDFIPLVSARSVPDNSRNSRTSNNPFRLNFKTSNTGNSNSNGSRWVSCYSQTTSIKSPILIDLTGGKFLTNPNPNPNPNPNLNPNPNPNQPSSSSTTENIPVVDLTD